MTIFLCFLLVVIGLVFGFGENPQLARVGKSIAALVFLLLNLYIIVSDTYGYSQLAGSAAIWKWLPYAIFIDVLAICLLYIWKPLNEKKLSTAVIGLIGALALLVVVTSVAGDYNESFFADLANLLYWSEHIVLALGMLVVYFCFSKTPVVARLGKSVLCVIPLLLIMAFAMAVGPWERQYHMLVWSVGIICLLILLVCWLFIWKPFNAKARCRAVICLVGALVVYCGGVAGFMAYDESITFSFLDSYSHDIPLEEYEPFREDTLAKSLDEPSLLHLQDNLPRLEGATALYPVYAAFARAVYPEGEYSVYNKGDSSVTCSSTSLAFDLLINGETDIVFLMGVSKDQEEMALERGLELKLTPIGREAFVFFVNRRNSVSNLTVEDVRNIYSGQMTNWREVGGKNNLIRPYQRNENSGSQTMLLEVMGDTLLMTPPQTDVYNMMMGMYKAVAVYKNYKNSLGYSFMYYLNDMIAEDKIKLLSINGVPPTTANIAGGEYPLASEFYAITVIREPESELDAERINNTEKFIEWILSPQGQSLIEKTGYVSLR